VRYRKGVVLDSSGATMSDDLQGASRVHAPTSVPRPSKVGPSLRADGLTTLCLGMGWHMSRLYRETPPQNCVDSADRHERLPGVSSLNGRQRLLLGADQIDVALSRLRESGFLTDNLSWPTTERVRDLLEPAVPADKSHHDDFKSAVLSLHTELLMCLTATHFELGKAYGLGRALADTCRNRQSHAELVESFGEHRVAVIDAWLADLGSALPPHSSNAVRWSLGWWTEFIARSKEDAHGRAAAVTRQGQIWRSLLTGEKSAPDVLEPHHYLLAAKDMFQENAVLAYRAARSVVPILVLFLAAGLVVCGILLSSDAMPWARLVTGAVTIGTIGAAAWRVIRAALVGTVRRIEAPIWRGVLDRIIGKVITKSPERLV
jgi:hypothetical protein